jgi:hypothetical protein
MDIRTSEFYLWNLRYDIFQWQQFEFPSNPRCVMMGSREVILPKTPAREQFDSDSIQKI